MTSEKSLRVLRVASVANNRFGGMSRTMYCTGDCLEKMGHRIDYVFADSFCWKIPRQIQRYLTAWEASSIIRKRLANGEKWDVVEIHEPLAVAYGLARLRDRSLPPLVTFSYGIEARSYDTMVRYRKLKSIPFSLKSRTTSKLLVYQAYLGVKYSSHTICSNQADVDFLHTQRGIEESKLTRHHSGIEESFVTAGKAIQSRPAKGMLFLGNWLERKGIFDLVPAATTVLTKHPDAFLTIAGTNLPEEQILPSFSSTVRERIQIIPRIESFDELVKIYANHSIFLLPSYFEGHPLVMVEAAAMGLAIVTTPVCGMLDFISDKDSGRFFPVGDPAQFAATLDELLTHPQMTTALGTQAQRVAAQHTWESAAVKIEAAYRSAIDRESHAETRD